MKSIGIILLFPYFIYAQNTLTGKVVNAKTKLPVPFATVGIINQNVGTSAAEDGIFTLSMVTTAAIDTILVSCTGYTTLKMPYRFNEKESLTIELNEITNILNTVVLTNKKRLTEVALNDFTSCGTYFIGSNGYQTQLAQHFYMQEADAILTSIKICRFSMGIFYPEKTIFRVRIYDIDTVTKAPSIDLCDQIIEVKSSKRYIYLNLAKYNIHIPGKDFFVAIEWLKIPYNKSVSKRVGSGKAVYDTSYTPSIGWTDNESPNMEAWKLDYTNKWRPMYSYRAKTNVAISATVKY